MQCMRCGLCCQETEMLLSNEDIKRLDGVTGLRQKFTRQDNRGYVRLRNREGFCIFYDREKHRCRVYQHRPSGCRVYPIVYDEREGVVVDSLCPRKATVTTEDLKRKGDAVIRLLQRIDREAASRRKSPSRHQVPQ